MVVSFCWGFFGVTLIFFFVFSCSLSWFLPCCLCGFFLVFFLVFFLFTTDAATMVHPSISRAFGISVKIIFLSDKQNASLKEHIFTHDGSEPLPNHPTTCTVLGASGHYDIAYEWKHSEWRCPTCNYEGTKGCLYCRCTVVVLWLYCCCTVVVL